MRLVDRKLIIVVSFFIFICSCGSNETQNFIVPNEFITVYEFHPVEYLEGFSIKDVNLKLSSLEKANLKNLFIEASKATEKKYNQSYYISSSTPILKLLENNYPKLILKKQERGKLVLLKEIELALSVLEE